MKKRFLMTLPLLTLLFSSCGNSFPGSEGTDITEETEAEKKIKEIYELYKSNGGELSYEDWLATIKGEKGDPGDPGTPGKDGTSLLSGIGEPSPNLGNQGDLYLDISTYDLYIKTASGWVKSGNFKGEQGDPGVSVVSIVKTGENENVDTYTITYSDGNTSTFTVTNGVDGQSIEGKPGKDGHTPEIKINEDGYWEVDGVSTGILARGPQGDPGVSIVSIVKTGENENIDTYTITYSDGNTSTFTVTNGVDGQSIEGKPGKDGHTPEIKINEDGYWEVDGVSTGILARGPQGDPGLTPYIGENGNWWIGDKDTGVKAEGSQGDSGQTPYIGDNGNWWIGNKDTGVKAEGTNGKSAYEIAVENGFEGTEEEWLESLKGQDGETPQLPEKFVIGITYDNYVIYVHYSDGTVEEINLIPGDTPADPDDPEDPEDPDDPIAGKEVVYPGVYNKANAYQYDELANGWSTPGHLYVHYLRTSAKTYDDYDNYGFWTWQNSPQDLEGTLWGAPVGKYNKSLYAMSNERIDDIGGSKLDVDDFGVVYDVDLSRNDLVGGRSGQSVSFIGSTKIGFLLIDLSSTLTSSGHWSSDGGMETYIEIEDGWTSTTSKHIYVMEGDVRNYCESASSFASQYFPDVPEEFEAKLSAYSVTIEVGDTYQLSWTTNQPSELLITSSNENIVGVDQNGLVTAVGVGNAKVIFAFSAGKVVACNFTVKEKEIPEPPEEDIKLYVFLDYNQVDYDNPYFETMIAQGVEYNLYDLGFTDPDNNPNSPGARFIGWSLAPIVFSDDNLLDLSKLSIGYNTYYLYIYGIWEFVD